ncbi:MAG TPA: acyl-CoA dehydrogenase [Solirubrobacteraceae bacterium]|nr:acyl-CoA dehydrogenase [Solirubrobacteraceae bacterium]
MTATAGPLRLQSTLIPRRDLQFLLHEWLKVGELGARPAFAEQGAEIYDDVLELAERIAAERFAPVNREGDEHEPRIGPDGRVILAPGVAPALEAFFAAGLGGATAPEAVGGMGLPQVIGAAAMSLLQAANTGAAAYALLTTAAANLLLANGSPEQVQRYVAPMIEGRFYGTMCLSETQAGSSLADVSTRAIAQADGTHRIFGSKMWISAGDHELGENIIHLVLAKIPGGPAGVKGISLFIVPRVLVGEDGSAGERNDITLAGLNHKMGFRATVNTVLNFGEGTHRPGGEAGAVGYLVGEPHRGLAYMFTMMNEARTGVGLGATAVGYTGYLKSLAYARERPQGRPLGAKDPAAPQVPIIEHADVKRMLLAQKSYVEGALGLVLYCARLADEEATASTEEERHRANLLLEMLTPIAKAWPSQFCLEANSLAIQVHGGYGYAREYEVEQHYRDNRLNAIHEGTNGIQGLDLLGRKVTMQGGAGLVRLAETITAAVSRAREAAHPGGSGSGDAGGAGDPDLGALAATLEAALGRMLEVTGALWADGPAGAEVALANASLYLEAAGHTVIAWIWLEQLLAAAGREGAFYAGKRAAARYFYRYELPRTGPLWDLLESRDRLTLEMRDEYFSA